MLEPTSEYTVTIDDLCAPSGASSFKTTDNAPVPTTLGTVVTTTVETRDVSVTPWEPTGLCGMSLRGAVQELALEFSPEATPWKDLLVVETWVDGERWGHGTFMRPVIVHRGEHLIYASCDPKIDRGLALGPHSVTMRATLPGTDVLVETATRGDGLMSALPGPGGIV